MEVVLRGLDVSKKIHGLPMTKEQVERLKALSERLRVLLRKP